jgi:hypothetical protein
VASNCRDAALSQTVGERADRHSLGPQLKESRYDRPEDRIPDQLPAAVPAVAGRRPTGIDAAVNRLLPRREPVRADAIELPLGHREHDPVDESSGVRSEVEPVFHRDERSPRRGYPLDSTEPVDQGSPEAVELGDHDSPRFASLDPAYRPEQ